MQSPILPIRPSRRVAQIRLPAGWAVPTGARAMVRSTWTSKTAAVGDPIEEAQSKY